VGIEEIGSNYQIVVTKKGYMDEIEILVELLDQTLLENFKELESIQKKIRGRLRTVLSIDAKVRLVQHKTLERFEGKAKRIVDLR
jgi:phenylacetate-CoA ligase